MTLSMYEASVPVFSARLKALSGVLSAAEQNATERKIDPQVFLTARLAPDMYALVRQVQVATDHAKGAPSRLARREVPKYEDNEATFAELQARLTKTLDLLASFSAAEFDGSDERVVELKFGQREASMPGMQYLLHVAMPNFYFHVTTAYDILRHNGVPLTKGAYVGNR
ncbi:DUF1993 family protein [Mesorhizobium sp. L2C066B000]|uniref:DUF1993 domain-containing protein n=1 Tax=Mesorhizobium sp. L2C066B000 TaxID=1287105 RepID=UPI0003D06840|nr:DUF1993 family protein [Mesorhizobium sp. L2C066B000]ESZ36455.1 hypothetical protein X732_23990 [Mesorhizobium sp. L2C066B000]